MASRPARHAAAGAGALLLLAALHAGAQASAPAHAPGQVVRTEIVAQVGAVRRLMVRPSPASPAPAQVQPGGAAIHRVEVEVATNVRCLLVVRGTSAAPVRLALDGTPASPVRAGEARVLRALLPGVHRFALSLEGIAGEGGALPVTIELADPVTGAVAVAPAAGRGAAMGSE